MLHENEQALQENSDPLHFKALFRSAWHAIVHVGRLGILGFRDGIAERVNESKWQMATLYEFLFSKTVTDNTHTWQKEMCL